MLTRRMTIGLVAAVTGGVLALGAGAMAFGGPGGRSGVMKRFAAAMIDDAIDQAQVTPEQRASVHAARDRVFAVVEAHHGQRRAGLEDVLQLFEADRLDAARLQALRARREEHQRQLADAVEQALTDVHGVLTPAQRRVVADYVRSHRRGHHWN